MSLGSVIYLRVGPREDASFWEVFSQRIHKADPQNINPDHLLVCDEKESMEGDNLSSDCNLVTYIGPQNFELFIVLQNVLVHSKAMIL
jgi:hypothetical protein